MHEPDDWADVVTANFVLNHVPDAHAAAAELGRVTASGGVVVATIWHGVTSPLRLLWDAVLERSAITLPPEQARPPELDFGRDADGVAALFHDAGLVDVRARIVSWDFVVSPERFWAGVEAGVA